MQAYDYYLKARALVDMARTVADLSDAREFCDRAIAIDPSYARAYACKAFSYIVAIMNLEFEDAAERRKLALHCANRAPPSIPSTASATGPRRDGFSAQAV